MRVMRVMITNKCNEGNEGVMITNKCNEGVMITNKCNEGNDNKQM